MYSIFREFKENYIVGWCEMAKTFDAEGLTEVKKTVKAFNKKIESEMTFKSDYKGNVLSFDWLDEFEEAWDSAD